MKRTTLFLALALLIILPLLADEIAFQGFEDSGADTWAYTAEPSENLEYFWGRTDENLGGATAQSGSYYWGSYLKEDNEVSLTFENVSLTSGTQHCLNFYYFTKNLNHSADRFDVCIEYDNGTGWNNWFQLLSIDQFEFDTGEWSLFSMNIPKDVSTVRVKVLAKYNNPSADKYVHWDSFSISESEAKLSAPVVYNVSVSQRRDGSGLVDIGYDLFDANYDHCEVSLMLSVDGGANFDYTPNPINLGGDIGEDVAPGVGKKVVWDAGAEGISFDSSQYMLQFKAEDGSTQMPENFILVESGSFTRSGYSVTLSSFYIDKYELTQKEWVDVMGSNPSNWKGDNLPVEKASWYDVIDYCNKRSVKEGLTPCYSINGNTSPSSWTSGTIVCNWNANGYRLPTEAEWEYAARGGNQSNGYKYSGSNNLAEVGWYASNSGSRTHPVGGKKSNELGIYDMSGNVWEWCWDWYGSFPSSPQNNPKGPESGANRVERGGSFYNFVAYCYVTKRISAAPSFIDNGLGVRLVRITP